MLKLTFQEFAFDDWESDEFYQLYIVRESEIVYYVGISQSSVWDRWFSNWHGRMQITPDGKLRSPSGDSISRKIIDNLPSSLNYLIELYTVDDCTKLLWREISEAHLNKDKLDIRFCERMLIEKFRPSLNERVG